METVKQIGKRTGVSVRTLHYYDEVGLLHPTQVTEAGYRLYDEEAVERLYMILLYRELGFSLKEIMEILNASDYDRNRILEQQARLLEAKKQHIQNLIFLTRGIKLSGVRNMSFEGFDPKKIEEYTAQAKLIWGNSPAYQESLEKAKGRSPEETSALGNQVMDFFAQLGRIKDQKPECAQAQSWAAQLQGFFTQHFYNCTDEILQGLGDVYAGGGTMTENIDTAGGPGTGAFAREVIRIYCANRKKE